MIKRSLLALVAASVLGAAHAQDAKPAANEPDPKIFQDIFTCLAAGLVQGWTKAWITVVELDRSEDGKSRNYEALFRQSLKADDKEGEPLAPCETAKIVKSIGDLNEYLTPEQRRWSEVTLTFMNDGKYEVKYDYAAAAQAKPAAKPAAGKPAAAKGGETKPAAKPAAKPAETKPGEPKKPGFKLQ